MRRVALSMLVLWTSPAMAQTSRDLLVPLRPYVTHEPEARCAALGAFIDAFASQKLGKNQLAVLQCEPLLQVPEAPWLVATLSYTHGNMTRVLQLCVREPPSPPAAVLARTGGTCEDEYFTAFERVAEAQAAGKPVDDLPHFLFVESDPELKELKPALLAWLTP